VVFDRGTKGRIRWIEKIRGQSNSSASERCGSLREVLQDSIGRSISVISVILNLMVEDFLNFVFGVFFIVLTVQSVWWRASLVEDVVVVWLQSVLREDRVHSALFVAS
jgi:hypothetical protein